MKRLLLPNLLVPLLLLAACEGTDVSDVTADVSEPDAPESDAADEPACNGHPALCDRTLPEITIPMTHNAMSNTDDEWVPPNQQHGIARQLEDGIRGMMLDVHEHEGDLRLCHGVCHEFLGMRLLADGLADIRAFLEAHPREVLVLIFEDHVPDEDLAAAVESAGLADYAYTHDPAQGWPTLAEMIDADTRLLVTAENADPPPAWLHHVWALAWDTPYSYESREEFTCEPNRGDPDNPLFLLNHWIHEGGAPWREGAATTNSFEVLHGRATDCQAASGQLPNFIAVDHYATGDLFEVVDALNGLPPEGR
ncbi:MAG: phosphatidylinositol-specific phospholipase C domain-containing protein [Myxococcota bacterium]